MCDRPGQALLTIVLAVGLMPAAAAGERRDPLRPPDHQSSTSRQPRFDASAWRLESTLIADDRRVAIVNGRAVHRGDRVGGARVLAIDGGRVRLEYEGHDFTVRPTTPDIRRGTGRADP